MARTDDSASIIDVFNDPRMTFSGRRIAFVLAILLVCFLPKRVELGHHDYCTHYKLEPLAIYGIESVFGPTGIAYTTGDDCR